MPLNRSIHALAILSLATTVAACGGDEPSSTPTTPANRAPVFSSATSTTTAENVAGTFYQANASDADGDSVSYSLSGADAARFTLSASGELSFVTPPDFDLPTDSDRDNVYRVDVNASDGKLSTSLALTVNVTNSKEGIVVRRVAAGFSDLAAIAPINDTAILVAEKAGAIYLLNPQVGTRTLLIQIADVGNVGVTALAVAPTFASDGKFFVMYTTRGGLLQIGRYGRNPAGPTVPFAFGPALATLAPDYAGGGWLGFDAAGDLLAATGDAGRIGDPAGSAQGDFYLGKLLRIRPVPDPYAGASVSYYSISIEAKGFHRPYGGSLIGGDLLIADRGQDVAEELNLLPTGSTGGNLGWPFKEGTRVVQGTPPAGLTDPVLEYFRSSGFRTGQSIVGGAKGPSAIASLVDRYVFGDASGAIFTVPIALLRSGTTLSSDVMERRDADFAPDQGAIDRPVAFTRSPDNAFYIADSDGDIFVVAGG